MIRAFGFGPRVPATRCESETRTTLLLMREFLSFLRHVHESMLLVRHPLFVLSALLLIGAVVIAFAEDMRFGDALYLTLITGLTVGYGDITPVTVLGRVVSILIGLTGLIFFGLVVAIATRALGEVAKEERQRRGS